MSAGWRPAAWFPGLAPAARAVSCLLMVLAVGVADHLTGYERSFAIFYLIPIFLGSWFVGRRVGLGLSGLSAVAWLVADHTSGNHYSHPLTPYWNAAVALTFFLAVWLLTDSLRRSMARERTLARIDSLTGAMNTRAFVEETGRVLNVAGRQGRPFSLLNMDVDNFKLVNDTRGHSEGDRVLAVVAGTLRASVRNYDAVARLGGDEFAVLLPETTAAEARAICTQVHARLREVAARHDWPVSFSMGVVTFTQPPPSVDEAIRRADRVMYHVKNNGKDSLVFEEWTGEAAPDASPRRRAAVRGAE